MTPINGSQVNKSRPRRERTPEQKARINAYMRQYRAEHPDNVRRWRENWVLNAAKRVEAQRQGGGDVGFD